MNALLFLSRLFEDKMLSMFDFAVYLIATLMSAVLVLVIYESKVYSATALTQMPEIKQIQRSVNFEIRIKGIKFGRSCQRCEVIAQYSSGFKYAHSVISWSNNSIVVNVPDISKGQAMSLVVKNTQGQSNEMKTNLKPHQAYKKNFNRVLKSQSKGVVLYQRQHNDSLGGKGIDQFKLSTKSPSCGQSSFAFDHAKILYEEKRFSEAKITQTPKAGCIQCSPLSVSWINEPTGKLDYQLQVYQREIAGICSDKVRR